MKMHLMAAAIVAAMFALPGAASAQNLATEEGKASYALGYRAGAEIANVRATGETVDMAAVIKGLEDAAARKEPAVAREPMADALLALQGRMTARYRSKLEQRATANKVEGDAFMAQNRAKPGVRELASGVQYRELEAGSGQRPTPAHQITVEFVNALPDGTVIADTSAPSEGMPAGPVTVRLSEIAFPGLREALQLMPAGARWEVVVPGSQAYGDDIDQVRELASQALVFNIKLISVGGIVPAPGG